MLIPVHDGNLLYIKNENRSSISKGRLNNLCLMCIECDLLNSFDFENIVADFPLRKSRNVQI